MDVKLLFNTWIKLLASLMWYVILWHATCVCCYRSNLLWVHAILCIVYIVLAVVLMRHFSVNLTFVD